MNIYTWMEKIFFPTNVMVFGTFVYIALIGNYLNNVLAFLIFGLVPYLFLVYIRKKKSKDYNYTHLQSSLFALAIFNLAIFFLPVSKEFQLAVFSVMMIMLISHFIRPRYKISGHVITFTTFATILSLENLNFIYLFVVVALLGWSRFKLKRHDELQIIAGFSLGLLIPLIIFQFIRM